MTSQHADVDNCGPIFKSGSVPERYTITSALPYANGPVHIGHLAGVYVPADIYARYLRSKGRDVIFIGGSDEHGVPITIKARKQDTTPQAIVDHYHGLIKESFEKFGISFDIYSRTSSSMHAATASEFFKTLYDKGCFIEKTSWQYYDEENKQFLADRYITGTCPRCNSEGAYGDQCEKCGSSLSPDELIDPRSAISGNAPVKKETKHWYLPLDRYEEFLREWILKGHEKDWRTNVYGQCKSWIDGGLQPRAVTRDLDWGVPLPLPHTEGKVLYVWFDAPIGYISATKELLPDAWEKYWKDEKTKLVHFIGKDNIVFHCIIFPCMLKAEGSYLLPDNVPANEFLNLEGDKISTSRNWAVWLHEYLDDFPGKQDVLRYVLTANAPESKDNDFTWKDFQARNNNELLAVFGNFVNRTVVLTHKYFEGKVPSATAYTQADKTTLEEMCAYPGKIAESLENYRFREALNEMMNLARLGNKYLTDNEPWKVFKTDPERVKTVLNVSLQIAAHLSVLCQPFLPFTAEKLCRILNMSPLGWDEACRAELLSGGHTLNPAEFLFEKIEDETIQKQIDKLQATKEANLKNALPAFEPQKAAVSFDDFGRIDLRVAQIVAAEKVAKTKKLLKLTLNTGLDTRIVVSGIAEYYGPEEVIGKKVCLLANLEPKNLKGIESHGMLLLSENPDGKLCFVEPSPQAEVGMQIR
ncbi:MAG: methionine--tRNA ligase [Bacteroidales bacterium]|nr:methionine--tRNA ligase [Bacteroidales bacterium]MDE7073345.1 methionine--tRNA ligase [Bacteroidales bacterium]